MNTDHRAGCQGPGCVCGRVIEHRGLMWGVMRVAGKPGKRVYRGLAGKEIFNTIITSLKALDESFSSRNHVRKLLRSLPTKWRPKVVLEKDLEISKNKKEKYKSLALKSRKVLNEEEKTSLDSNDEEYTMAVRDFKKFFRRRGKFVRQPHYDKRNFQKVKEDKKEKDDRRCFKCGDPNQFISDCPKHSFSDQKAFVVGCWSDSKDDSKKEEICLMALDNNEVRLKVKLEPDEWIKDSGRSRHMTDNKDLFSSYKTIDGGNVVFGGNTKSKIVKKGTITHNSLTIHDGLVEVEETSFLVDKGVGSDMVDFDIPGVDLDFQS
nr:zf-CCHC domain-containing protein/UBN2 domain-containing protein [Tanacetum cinerariifolium]